MEARYWLWLSLKRKLKAINCQKLMGDHKDPKGIYELSEGEIRKIPFLNEREIAQLCDKSLDEAKKVYETCKESGIRIVPLDHRYYPERLKNIFLPPLILYEKGMLIDFDDEAAISIVGTRHPSAYGAIATGRLAFDLSCAGMLVVSGMAEGIDTAANSGALKAGARTVAVLGCGVDICYPQKNRKLYENIIKCGTVVSEYPPGEKPLPQNFPARNRIISGLSLGVVIVEAPMSPKRSGSLITADFAAEQGRDVFAVPGNIDSVLSGGSNDLIKQGVKLVSCADDVISEYEERYAHKIAKNRINVQSMIFDGIDQISENKKGSAASDGGIAKVKAAPVIAGLNENEAAVVKALLDEALNVDSAVEKTGLPVAEILTVMTVLEIKKLIKQLPGGKYAINEQAVL